MTYAALHFHDLELHCLLSQEALPAQQPAALLSLGDRDKSHLLAVNAAARALEIHPGLSTARGLARCSHLHLLTPNPTTFKSTQKEILAFTESLTPDFEQTSPDTFLLDLSTLLIASLDDWVAHTHQQSLYLGLPLHIGLGNTPDLAHLSSFLQPTRKHHYTSDPLPLPLDQLLHQKAFPISQLPTLQLWGITHLAHLAKLPHQGLTERLGPEMAHLHHILHGKTHRLLTLYRPTTDYTARHIFEPPIDHLEPILFIAKRLLKTLCNRLRHHQRAASELHFTLGYDNGAAHFRKLTIAEPTLTEDIILRQLSTHLDQLKAPAPISEFHLLLTPALPLHAQHEIFRKGLKDPNQFQDTLQRLAGIVGSQSVGIPQLTDQFRPDSHILHPYTPQLDLSKTPKTSSPSFTSFLPLSRKRPPLSISVASEKDKHSPYQRPLALLTGPHQGPIKNTRGPFPLSGNWWENNWQQAQWDIEMADHHLLQLTYTPPDHWHLTGHYA